MEQLFQKQILPISLDEAWDFFSSPRNLDEITPEDLGFRIVSCAEGEMYEGQIITYKIGIAPGLSVSWVTEIKAVEERKAFVDEQRFGPYRFWHHRHHFEEVANGVEMTDLVHWALPFEPFTWPVKVFFVKPKVDRIFQHRRQILEERFGRA
ncbi:MAG: SRPBCC family protein [Verrucomicrobiota bacterium JB023]|nr:SRPBCC family protein [Verrucomicrobiota bacterium JB023]